jgi:hypothetical protein
VTQRTLVVREIEVIATGFFTTHHTFQTEAGVLGKLTFPAFSQQGEFQTAGGRRLLMQKTHWLGTAHELVEGHTVRGSADRPGLFRRDLLVQFDGADYSLQPAGLFSQDWVLYDAGGTPVLEIQPRGFWKQSTYLTIWSAIDADLVAFAYYLVYMRRQEDAAGVAAASGAAAS